MTNVEQISAQAYSKQVNNDFLADMQRLFNEQKRAFEGEKFLSYGRRIRDLKALKQAVLTNKDALLDALEKDFQYRSHDESMLGDIFSSLSSIDYAIKHLSHWMKPQKRTVGIVFQPAHAKVMYQPRGVVGIIAPWNYPVFLTIGPLVAALSAGNRVMIKTSEFTPNTNAVLSKMLSSIFGPSKVCVIEGEIDVARAFSSLKFDRLLFTGSTEVGRHVMKAAAENLVPVTLELGGKSPVIIDDRIDLDEAVKRFIYGKTMNAGQTCVSPDYVYCPKGRVSELKRAIQVRYQSMYPDDEGIAYRTRVINAKQYRRLVGYLDDAKQRGAEIIALGAPSEKPDDCFMPLTLVLGVDREMKVMQDEIFGPILPIIEYTNLEDVITDINNHPRPLGLYIQSFDKTFQQILLERTHAGGVCINDAAFHVVVDDLPFGGVGASGIGSYHGIEGFRTFSHAKAVLSRGRLFFSDMLFPPYGRKIHALFYRFFVR